MPIGIRFEDMTGPNDEKISADTWSCLNTDIVDASGEASHHEIQVKRGKLCRSSAACKFLFRLNRIQQIRPMYVYLQAYGYAEKTVDSLIAIRQFLSRRDPRYWRQMLLKRLCMRIIPFKRFPFVSW